MEAIHTSSLVTSSGKPSQYALALGRCPLRDVPAARPVRPTQAQAAALATGRLVIVVTPNG